MKAIFCLEENKEPATEIAKACDLEVIKASCKKFSGREVLLTFEPIPAVDEAIIVHQLHPNPADKIIELLLMLDALEKHGIKNATLISAYIPYLRQDRELAENSAIASRMLAKIIDSSIINKIITVDCHSQKGIDFFKTKIENLDPSEFFASFLEDKGSNAIVISPDQGSKHRAASLSSLLNLPYVAMEKTRTDGGVVVSETSRTSHKTSLRGGRSPTWQSHEVMTSKLMGSPRHASMPRDDVVWLTNDNLQTGIIIDDIIDSGATIIATLEALKDSFDKIFVCATHIINIDVKDKIEAAYNNVKIITTNSTNYSNNDKLENIWEFIGKAGG